MGLVYLMSLMEQRAILQFRGIGNLCTSFICQSNQTRNIISGQGLKALKERTRQRSYQGRQLVRGKVIDVLISAQECNNGAIKWQAAMKKKRKLSEGQKPGKYGNNTGRQLTSAFPAQLRTPVALFPFLGMETPQVCWGAGRNIQSSIYIVPKKLQLVKTIKIRTILHTHSQHSPQEIGCIARGHEISQLWN